MIDTNNRSVNLESDTNYHIFDNLQDGVAVYEVVCDVLGEFTNLRVKYINKTSIIREFMAGEDACGKNITELYECDVASLYLKIAGEILKSGESKKFKTYFKTVDKYYSVSAYLFDDKTLITISTDVTEKEKVEEELRKQADLLDLTRDAIIVRDMGDRIIFWNHGAEERYGWTREEAYGKVTYNLLKTGFQEPLTKIFNQLFQKGHWEGEVTHTRRDGEKIVVLSRWELQKNENNEPTGYMEINTDITEHKKVDEALKHEVFVASQTAKALKESESRLRAIIEHSPDVIAVIDLNGNIIECNTVAMNLFGFTSKEELNGFNTFDLIAPDDKLRAFNDMAQTLSKGYLNNTNYDVLTQNGDIFPIEASVGVILDNGKPNAFVCVARDITERRKIEVELKQARNNLEEQVKERTAELEKAYDALKREALGASQNAKALKESEEKFRGIFSNANDMITLNLITENGLPGRFIEINEVGIKRLGYSREEILDMTPYDIIIPYNHDKKQSDTVNIFKKGNYQFETVELTKDGKKIPVDISTQFIDYGGIRACLAISRDITERKKTENTLQFQANILKNVRDAVIVYDLQGKIIYWNKGAESVYGYSKGEIRDKNIKILYLDRDNGKFSTDLEEIMESGEYVGEWEGKRKDGSTVFVDIIETVMYDTNGEIIGIIGVSKDINERKEAEKALNDSEKQLRMITNNMIDMVSQTDINGVIQYVSPSHTLVLGYKSEDLLGKTIYSFIHPHDLERVEESCKEALSTGRPDKIEARFRHAEEHYIWLEIVGNLFFDEKHLIKGAIFGARDINERKKVEEQIKRQYSVLNGINRIFRESLTSGTKEEVAEVSLNVAERLTGSEIGFIAEISDDGTLDGIALSSSALKSYKASSSEVPKLIKRMKISSYLGRAIREEKPQIVNDPDSDPDKKGIPEGHPMINSFLGFPLKQADKTIGLIALSNKNGGYTFEDIETIQSLSVAVIEALIGFKSRNKLKKYKNRLEETIGDLKRSNEELQRFAYVASHDLQEPLRTIASFTQLLERRYKGKLDDDADEFIDYIVEAAIRMKEQIKGLLEYSRIATRENEFKPVDSGFVLDQAVENLQFAVNENNAEITRDSMQVIMCDAGQLQRIFQNLISNSIKFKKENEHPKIHISCRKDEKNREYVFSVVDNGIGIEKQYMDRIFVIFQRLHTRDEYNGTGIGLSIVKRIIERHGGRIWVESEVGEGSVFCFTIPC